MISTLRFSCRPRSVSLDAIGSASPTPRVPPMVSDEIPWLTRNSRTAKARSRDNSRLYWLEPVESVCPSIEICKSSVELSVFAILWSLPEPEV